LAMPGWEVFGATRIGMPGTQAVDGRMSHVSSKVIISVDRGRADLKVALHIGLAGGVGTCATV